MDSHIELLKQFTQMVRANSDILHDSKFAFFKDFIESLGGTIPAKKEKTPESAEKTSPPTSEAKDEPMPEPEPEEPEVPAPELDNSGVIEADSGEPLPMGDSDKEVSDDDMEKANEIRDQAMGAFSEGEFEKAVELFTQAIVLNPGLAILHARRANALLKLKRPVAAITDCDKAISINPDSAQGYKFRGRANRLLGKWVEAHADLATACKLDYDDTANEWLKECEPNAKKVHEYERAIARQKEEKELKERRERVRRAQEANRKAAEEAAQFEDEDMGEGGGQMPPGFANLFSDPEVASALNDPEVMTAFSEIMSNPANLAKHISNPKVMKLVAKMQGMGMGGGGGAGAAGGMPFGFGGAGGPPGEGCPKSDCCGSGGCADEPSTAGAPKKAPEPDLD